MSKYGTLSDTGYKRRGVPLGISVLTHLSMNDNLTSRGAERRPKSPKWSVTCKASCKTIRFIFA